LTFYGGSVTLAASGGALARRGQRFVRIDSTLGAADIQLPTKEKLGGSGLFFQVLNEGSNDVTIQDSDLVDLGIVLPNRVVFVFFIASEEVLNAGDWILVGSGNYTQGDQGGEGEIKLRYGTVLAPAGTRLNLGTAFTEPEGIDISLGSFLPDVGGIPYTPS
tara:strand:- start:137 stop:622 length:486 start_codon:yes stop_codon:yes gene_type:complete